MYTTSVANLDSDIVNGGYVSQGDAGYIFTEQAPNSVPLYRLYSTTLTDHYYTVNETDKDYMITKGYTYEWVEGYAYNTSLCGAVPFYMAYNPKAPDHFYTVNLTERDAAITTGGYVDQGISMYIFPPV